MSGSGAPRVDVHAPDLRVAVVAASWHDTVMDGLIAGALRAAGDAGIEPEVVRVPGSFELPVVAAELADRFDAVVALGVVIRGGTPHFDYVCQAATDGLVELVDNPAHRRSRLVRLTPAGDAASTAVIERELSLLERVGGDLTAAELDGTLRVLLHMDLALIALEEDDR